MLRYSPARLTILSGSSLQHWCVGISTEKCSLLGSSLHTLMMHVLRRYRLAARPATSRHTPPPMAMMGSWRLQSNSGQPDVAPVSGTMPKGKHTYSCACRSCCWGSNVCESDCRLPAGCGTPEAVRSVLIVRHAVIREAGKPRRQIGSQSH